MIIKINYLSFAAIGLLCGLSTGLNAADTVTTQSLLREMTSRDTIAKWPAPAYTNKQFSSASPVADDPKNSETWFHNEDWSNFIRVEKVDGHFEHVMFEAKGPGAVVRFWNTVINGNFHNGTLRIYIDGAKDPAVVGKNGEVISGGKLVGEPLSSSSAPGTAHFKRGHNLYLPIPYAQSCKITYEQPGGQKIGKEFYYYNINYRTYEAGTKVESFSLDRLKQAKTTLDETQKALAEANPNAGSSRVDHSLSGKILAGESKSLTLEAEAAGGSIRRLEFKVNAVNLPQALRSTVMEITFDGERTVWCPLGDFFGTGYQIRPVQFWYGSVTADGLMQAHWVMPYQKGAKITVHNLGSQDIQLAKASVSIGAWSWDERSMHFGSSWHQMTSVKSGATENYHGGRGAYDMNYVSLKGQGIYVGDTLTLFDCARQWWGEGDEKIFVDGEAFPSHFGTGTEDYYGYAWSIGAKFNTPFITQPDGTGDLGVGYVVNGRYRLLDGIPFEKSIQVDMEQWHWMKTYMDIAPTTYWYGRPGATSNINPDIKAATHPVAIAISDVMPAPALDEQGVIEGEQMSIISASGGRAEAQKLSGGWSGDAQLWWKNGKIGDVLKLRFDAPSKWTGTRKLTLSLTNAVDYAQVEISLNGKTVASKVDGFEADLGLSELNLSNVNLIEGANTLEIKIIGSHGDAKPGMMFGLDRLQVQ